MIYDAIFLITSAMKTIDSLSIYTKKERFNQLVETIESIKKYASPNHLIYLIDGSIEDASEELDKIEKMGVHVFKAYEYSNVKQYAQQGYKIFIENLCLLYFLDWFNKNPQKAKRIYKISGRYTLTENFTHGFEHENAFVFLRSFDSWMPKEHQEIANVKKFYETRLYHFDYNLLEVYRNELINMINESMKYNINVEHSMYKFLSKYNVVEVNKIGVKGYISANGEYKNE